VSRKLRGWEQGGRNITGLRTRPFLWRFKTNSFQIRHNSPQQGLLHREGSVEAELVPARFRLRQRVTWARRNRRQESGRTSRCGEDQSRRPEWHFHAESGQFRTRQPVERGSDRIDSHWSDWGGHSMTYSYTQLSHYLTLPTPLPLSLPRWLAGEGHTGRNALRKGLREGIGGVIPP